MLEIGSYSETVIPLIYRYTFRMVDVDTKDDIVQYFRDSDHELTEEEIEEFETDLLQEAEEEFVRITEIENKFKPFPK